MTAIRLLTSGIRVDPLLWALREHPEFWDENTSRTEDPNSPHHELSDIWARFAAPGVDGSKKHESVWYPCADVLPIKPITIPLMQFVQGQELGGVLITKIPAGKSCKPHSDPGWHARYYEKFAVQVDSAPGQAFCFEDETLVSRPGDLFWFDNAHKHWVINESPYDRITMIVCIRR